MSDKVPAKRTPKRRTTRAVKVKNRAQGTVGRLGDLEKLVGIINDTVGTLTSHVGKLSDALLNLNGSLKVIDKGSREITRFLTSQIVALRDLLIAKQLVTAEEAAAVAQIADLERMFDQLSDTAPKDPESDAPTGGSQ